MSCSNVKSHSYIGMLYCEGVSSSWTITIRNDHLFCHVGELLLFFYRINVYMEEKIYAIIVYYGHAVHVFNGLKQTHVHLYFYDFYVETLPGS